MLETTARSRWFELYREILPVLVASAAPAVLLQLQAGNEPVVKGIVEMAALMADAAMAEVVKRESVDDNEPQYGVTVTRTPRDSECECVGCVPSPSPLPGK
jgi:hypothetical protein